MGIKDLPKPGIGFRATLGPGSFKRKLSGATRYGDLRNLRDNQPAIVEAIKKYQGAIRTKGGLSRLQQLVARRKMQASDGTITKEDKREIKQILKHLGRGAAASEKKPLVDKKPTKAKDNLTEEQAERNLNRTRRDRIDESGINRRTFRKQYAGDREVTSYGLYSGVAEDIGAGRGKVGFAADYNKKNDKSPDNPASKIPLAGIKPLGL